MCHTHAFAFLHERKSYTVNTLAVIRVITPKDNNNSSSSNKDKDKNEHRPNAN